MKRLFIILAAVVALGWAGSASAQSCTASANGYTYCQVLAVASGQIPGALTNFPIPFCFNMTEGNGNSCPVNVYLRNVGYPAQIKHTVTFAGQTCPADLNFYSDSAGATPLNWDCAYYSPTSGALEVYVQMSVTTGVNYVYMYFGNAAVTTFQGGVVGAAWDASFQGVLHVSDGTTLNIADSKNVQTPSNSGSTASTGQINGGVAVSSQHIVVKSAKILGGALNFTVHAWIKTGANRGSVYSERGTSGNDILKMDVHTGVCPNLVEFAYRDDAGNLEELCSVTTVTNSAWHQVDIVSIGSPSAMSIYIDGNSDSSFSSTVTNTFTNATLASWAGQDNGDAGANFIGNIDELEFSSTNRSANWIKASYNAESAPSTFFSVNTPSPTPPPQFPATLTGILTGQLISAPPLPQVTPSATYPLDTGYTLTAVASGANLQTAINAAACGTKLNLAHGGTFTAGSAWTLPNNSCACHTDSTKWQIIQGDQFEANYVPGVRVDPSVQYAQFPHLSNSDANYAFTANTNGASCWGFAGLDVTETTDGATAVLSLGDGSVTVANFPHDFAVWGSSIHGQASKGLTRCIVFNGNWGAVVDSYLSDCHKVGQDSQAVEMWDGLGPLLVQNTFLEGAAENILIGGSDPHAGVIPSDLTFQRNHFFKPLSWRVADPSSSRSTTDHWAVKNCFELKDAQRVLITGNVFENGWGDGQNGQCITWNSSNQGGNDPQAVIADINMYLNLIRHFTQAYGIAGNTNPTYQSDHRISIHDNLSWDIDACIWTNCYQNPVPDISLGGRNNGTLYATYDLWINHETIASREGQAQGGAINFQPTDSTPYYGFNVTNSILNNGAYGAFYRSAGSGDAIMPSLTPGGKANNDCIYGSTASGFNNAIFNGKQIVTAGQSGVFVTPGVDFHVAPASLCHNAASDGTDMGANIDAVNAATAGVVQTLGNLHTVTNVSPSTFTHLGSTSITITGTNFISGAAEVIVGGAGPVAAVSTDICAVNTCTVVTSAPITLAVNDTVNMAGMVNGLSLNPNQGQFLVASVTDTTHFTYTDNGIGTQSWLGGTANRITPGNACASVVVVNSTTITCVTPAATGTVTNGPVSVFVSQFGIPVQSTVYGAYN